MPGVVIFSYGLRGFNDKIIIREKSFKYLTDTAGKLLPFKTVLFPQGQQGIKLPKRWLFLRSKIACFFTAELRILLIYTKDQVAYTYMLTTFQGIPDYKKNDHCTQASA